MKQAAARSRKGVVGKSGKKTPKVPKPTEKIPVIRKNRRRTLGLIIYYITVKVRLSENRNKDTCGNR